MKGVRVCHSAAFTLYIRSAQAGGGLSASAGASASGERRERQATVVGRSLSGSGAKAGARQLVRSLSGPRAARGAGAAPRAPRAAEGDDDPGVDCVGNAYCYGST